MRSFDSSDIGAVAANTMREDFFGQPSTSFAQRPQVVLESDSMRHVFHLANGI